MFTGFEQSRNFSFDNLSWDYRKRLINQKFDCGCDFIYLLNSPRPLDIENPDFPKKLEKLELLLSELRKIGVKKHLNGYTMYLKGVDNIKNIENYSIADFLHHLNNNPVLKQLTVKDYKKYLPKISYFKANGHLCSTRCSVKCFYCYNCAGKIQKEFVKNQKEAKINKFVQTCKI